MERNFTQYASARARPTLGQQKTLDLKKARSLREIAWLTSKIGAAILAFVVLVSLLASFRSYLLRAPKFAIGIKEIQGLRHLSEGQVLLKLKEIEEQDRSLFALDLDALRKSVELLPWVKAATVRRVWPDRLMIQVTERVPIAFVRIDDSTQMVDEEGVLLESKGEGLPNFDFPVLMGLESGFETELLMRNRRVRIRARRLFFTGKVTRDIGYIDVCVGPHCIQLTVPNLENFPDLLASCNERYKLHIEEDTLAEFQITISERWVEAIESLGGDYGWAVFSPAIG